MSTEALPCIVCGTALRNVWEEAENQPSEGVAATTYGNYGSTVFDPVMTGEFLEFNVCDRCLVLAGAQGRIYTARTKRPVAMDGLGIVGWIEAPYTPVVWREGLPGYDDLLVVSSLEEFQSIGGNLSPGVTEEMLLNAEG